MVNPVFTRIFGRWRGLPLPRSSRWVEIFFLLSPRRSDTWRDRVMSDELRSTGRTVRSGRKWRTSFLTTFVILSLHFFVSTPLSAQGDPASEWNLLYYKIRDRFISKEEARTRLGVLEIQLRDDYSKQRKGGSDGGFAFPLEGYTFRSIGGKDGSGYQPLGYDFFDGNDHKGHPGHDIFILDKNQDSLDDKTGKPVNVISVSPGIVVSTNTLWEPSSLIRGGNYLWIFDPATKRYFYYAHLDKVFVTVGQVISKGNLLGTVGRTGLNAYPKRSPTHLHFTVHQSADGYPRPVNVYKELANKERDRVRDA
jgi:murein DD-endopeptidase MepM/ murein hydrolase activator NlpD